jgi:dTDP-4-amino-4,6-dideoxygalactose transaminase
MQAAELLQKLTVFDEEVDARNRIATRYNDLLSDVATVPKVRDDCTSVWAQYTLRIPADRRDGFAASLKRRGVPTGVYYRRPLHLQTAYRTYPIAETGLNVSEALARQVISLPMHPYLDAAAQDRVIEAVRIALS